jgi:curli biogenesis system outer membrane secretion channel CsgG
MLVQLLILGLLSQVPAGSDVTKSTPASTNQTTDQESDAKALLKVRRIYVDSFGDDIISKELQSMIVSALVASKEFKVTENRERADAVLKGVALENTSQEVHAYGEATSVGAAGGGGHSEISGSGGNISGSSSGGFVARHMGTQDSSLNTETIHEARIAIRLVNPDGDVIWTSTQESKGAKYKSASADVADMCVKQLLRDIAKLKTTDAAPSTKPATPEPSATTQK